MNDTGTITHRPQAPNTHYLPHRRWHNNTDSYATCCRRYPLSFTFSVSLSSLAALISHPPPPHPFPPPPQPPSCLSGRLTLPHTQQETHPADRAPTHPTTVAPPPSQTNSPPVLHTSVVNTRNISFTITATIHNEMHSIKNTHTPLTSGRLTRPNRSQNLTHENGLTNHTVEPTT